MYKSFSYVDSAWSFGLITQSRAIKSLSLTNWNTVVQKIMQFSNFCWDCFWATISSYEKSQDNWIACVHYCQPIIYEQQIVKLWYSILVAFFSFSFFFFLFLRKRYFSHCCTTIQPEHPHIIIYVKVNPIWNNITS